MVFVILNPIITKVDTLDMKNILDFDESYNKIEKLLHKMMKY